MFGGSEIQVVHLFLGVAVAANLLVLGMMVLLVRGPIAGDRDVHALSWLVSFSTMIMVVEALETAIRGPIPAGDLFDLRLLIRLLAFAFLYAFASRVMPARRRSITLLSAAGLAAVAVAILVDPDWATVVARGLFGLPAGILAAIGLRRMTAREPEATRGWLRALAILVAAYALAESAVYPAVQAAGLAPLYPPDVVTIWTTSARTLEAVFGILAALFVGVFVHTRLMSSSASVSTRRRVYLAGVVSLTVVILFVGVLEAEVGARQEERAVLGELAGDAEVAAYFVRVASYDAAGGTDVSYGNVGAHLATILTTQERFRQVFIFQASVDDVELLLNERGPDAVDANPVACMRSADDLHDTLMAGRVWVAERDEDGACVSLAAPLRTLDGGDILALGMEVDAREIRHAATRYRTTTWGIMALAVVAVLTAGRAGIVRRRDESRLIASERRLRLLFQAAPGAALLVEPVTRSISDANEAASEWLGYDPDTLKLMALDDIDGHSAESLDDFFARAAEAGSAESAFREVITAGGVVRQAEYRMSMIDFSGQTMAFVFARDTTAQRSLEETLTGHAATQRVLADIATEFVTVTPERIEQVVADYLGRIGRYLSADRISFFRARASGPPFEIAHQWTSDGSEAFDHTHHFPTEEGQECWLSDMIRATDTVFVVTREAALEHAPSLAAAMERTGAVTFTVVPLMQGADVLGFIGIDSDRERTGWLDEDVAMLRTVADILSTGLLRLQTEAEIARLSQALMQSPVGVLITDDNGDIEWVNPKFEQISGYSSAEVLGHNPRMLSAGMTDPLVYEALWSTILSGQVWSGELANQRKDGTLWWAGMTISALMDPSGRVVSYIGVQQDITTSKEVQATLQIAKSAAEDANRAKSEFLSTMSHEIRTPMNAIIGMSELLAETGLDEDQARYVGTLESAGEALLDLIDDVLDLSKIEAGRVDLESVVFEPARLAEEVAEVIAVRVREKPVEILVHIGAAVPEVVGGDRHRLRQVLLNLMGNAVKFTEKGHILLEVTRDDAYVMADRVRLRFEVVDTGIGISKEKQTRIFDAFAQADSSTTREYGGTGLGLAISRKIVELMGGNMGLRSRPGKGSTFAFTAVFDLTDSEVHVAPRIDADVDVSDARILVVDDNQVNRMIVKDYLARTHVTIDEVTSGEEALEVLRTGQRAYDVILMDLAMPGIDGFQTVEAIRDERLGGAPAIVMLTSEDDVGDRVRVKDLGLEERLLKPVRRARLVEVVERAIAVSRSRVEEVVSPVRSAPQAPEASAEPTDALPPRRILLVEDSEDNRFLIQAFLRGRGDVIDVAENGAEAVDAFEKAEPGTYDLVLMDMQMPVMDGYEATRTIRRIEKDAGLPRTPITALTAFALEEEKQKSLAAGCDAHLTKPIRKAQLVEAIETHARR